MQTIAFIGVGIMGKSMVRNLRKAGYQVSIYSRTKARCQDVIDEGALWRPSVAQCVQGAQAVLSIVGFPPDVEEVYFGPSGVLENAAPGTYLIDMTTTSPSLARRIWEEAKARGLHALDAPVTGGDAGARAGTLTVLVGGEQEDFDACRELLAAMGKNLVYMGPAGAGQHAKLANQIAIAGALSGVCEALRYAQAQGLDREVLLSAISSGAAGSFQMSSLGPKMLKGDLAPGFLMKHFVKDMALAQEEAEGAGLILPVLRQVLSQCRTLEAEGMGELGTQALLSYYEK